MNPKEAVMLVDICKGKRVIEIGSFRGGSAEILAPHVKFITCIDPHEDIEWGDKDTSGYGITFGSDVQAEFLFSMRLFKNWKYIQKKSDDAVNDVNKVDCVFIDGWHSYEQCLADLKNYTPKAKKYVLVHDYCTMFGGVIAACTEYFKRLPDIVCDTLAIYKIGKDDIHA